MISHRSANFLPQVIGVIVNLSLLEASPEEGFFFSCSRLLEDSALEAEKGCEIEIKPFKAPVDFQMSSVQK